jgi:predicted dehydrogenase
MSAKEPREVGIGLIGAGWMGSVHASAYTRVREHYPELPVRPRLVIVADTLEARARAAATRFGFEAWTTNAVDVIEHPEVDAVSIATTNDMHVALAVALAERGKHFWGEKPLGRFPADTREIAAVAMRAGVRTLVGYNYRHAPAVVHARELIAAGEIGAVRTYRGQFLVDYASHPQRALSWRFSRELAGLGVLGDLMSHVVDMAQSLAGPIEAVVAETDIQIPRRPRGGGGVADQFSVADGELGDVENEDYVAALARFSDGAKATFEVSRVNIGHPVQMAFEVRGTRGALGWDYERMGELQLYGSDQTDPGFRRVFAAPGHGDFAHFQPDAGNPMSYNDLKVIEAKLFLESIINEVDPIPSVQEALATGEVLEAMRRSSHTGTWERVRTASGARSRPADIEPAAGQGVV